MFIFFFSKKTQILIITEDFCKECLQVEADGLVDIDLLGMVEIIFKSHSCLNGSFLDGRRDIYSTTRHGLDMDQATAAMKCLTQMENESLKAIVRTINYQFPSIIQ